MKLYNAEIFAKDFSFVGAQQLGAFEYEEDYLSLAPQSVVLFSKTAANVGDYIHITSLIDDEVVDGIISGIENKGAVKKVKIKPLLALLDIPALNSYADTMEALIANGLEQCYINSNDAEQTRQGMNITIGSSTALSPPEEKIINLYDYAAEYMKSHRIVVNMSLHPQDKRLDVIIGQNVKSGRVIEADLPNVLNKTIYYNDNGDNVNKIILVGADDSTATYYRTTEGTVTMEPSEGTRITPVIWEYKLLNYSGEEFAAQALIAAEETLKLSEFNNLIELEVISSDALIRPDALEFGESICVISSGARYSSVVTGKKYKDGKTTIICGAIRLELTKIIKRRK